MKRIRFAWLDLCAQVSLFLAQARYDDAMRVRAAAIEEAARSNAAATWMSVRLARAEEDAHLAAAQVRRYRQRAAVGLR